MKLSLLDHSYQYQELLNEEGVLNAFLQLDNEIEKIMEWPKEKVQKSKMLSYASYSHYKKLLKFNVPNYKKLINQRNIVTSVKVSREG